VEVLRYVHGLTDDDLKHVETIVHEGQPYQLLNPVAMLKAKAANVRDIKQDDIPPRHDREHLRLVARCLPKYLRDIHEAAVKDGTLEKHTLSILSYAFKTLQDPKTANTLRAEGIEPSLLIPEEFKESPLSRIRRACEHQLPRLVAPTTGQPQASGSDPIAPMPLDPPLVVQPPPEPTQPPIPPGEG
jgi:hypothetical protein